MSFCATWLSFRINTLTISLFQLWAVIKLKDDERKNIRNANR